MRQPRGRPGFASEPVAERRVGGQAGRHDLDGDAPVEPLIDGAYTVDMPAARDARGQEVATFEDPADQRVLGGRLHSMKFRSL